MIISHSCIRIAASALWCGAVTSLDTHVGVDRRGQDER